MKTIYGQDYLKIWFLLAIVISLMCGIVYIVAQQVYRHNANDPQFQMAEDAAYAIHNGADPKALIASSSSIEISKSLAPYLIIYDEKENAVTTGALLNGNVPKLPSGVIDYVKKNGQEVITWQPQPGIRQALVIKKAEVNSIVYLVAAGRSMRKVEERISMLPQLIAIGWIGSIVILFVVVWLQQKLSSKSNA